jgi:hypothetical protein
MNKAEASVLLEQVFTKIQRDKDISSELYAILLSLFPTVLSSAFEILDSGKVTKIECQDSKRFFYRVREAQSKGKNSFGSSSSGGGINNIPDKEELYDVKGDFCLCFFY